MARHEPAPEPNRVAAVVRAAARRVVPDLGWLRRSALASEAARDEGGRRPSRAALRERQERVLREWAVLREELTALAGERLADVGDLLGDARLEFTPGTAESAVRRDYTWAMEAFQAAGKLLDEAADLPDLAAAVVLADRALERFAAAHDRHAGRRPAARVVRCFYNPLHGPARGPHPERGGPHGGRPQGGRRGRRRPPSAREAAADRRPCCSPCRLAILAGQSPDVLPALVTVKVSRHRSTKVLVPYYAVPRQSSLWSATGCGAYDDTAPGRVLRGEHRRRAAVAP